MDNQTIVAIGALVVGVLGFLFGIFQHFSNRRVANVIYRVTQLTDFDLPDKFFIPLNAIPITIDVESVGSKKAESVNIRVVTASDITNFEMESGEHFEKEQDTRHIQIRVPSCNPGEKVKVAFQCVKAPAVINYINEITVTHSEGVGVDGKKIPITEMAIELPIPFWQPRLTYNFEKRKFQIR